MCMVRFLRANSPFGIFFSPSSFALTEQCFISSVCVYYIYILIFVVFFLLLWLYADNKYKRIPIRSWLFVENVIQIVFFSSSSRVFFSFRFTNNDKFYRTYISAWYLGMIFFPFPMWLKMTSQQQYTFFVFEQQCQAIDVFFYNLFMSNNYYKCNAQIGYEIALIKYNRAEDKHWFAIQNAAPRWYESAFN